MNIIKMISKIQMIFQPKIKRIKPQTQWPSENLEAEGYPERDAQGGRYGEHGTSRQLCGSRSDEPGASPRDGPASRH